MNYITPGLFFLSLMFFTSSAHFMSGFEESMRQFQQQMQQMGQNMQNHFGNYNGPRGPNWHGNNNWMPKIPSPQVPVFPKNFPFPPDCRRISDVQGLKYPDPEQNTNVNINVYPPRPIHKTVTHQTYECTDPRYREPFYMLESKVIYSTDGNNQSQSSSGKVAYYFKNGTEFNYQPDVQTRPLWDK